MLAVSALNPGEAAKTPPFQVLSFSFHSDVKKSMEFATEKH
jgi:hypothetical protein